MAYDGDALSAPIATQHTRFPFFVEIQGAEFLICEPLDAAFPPKKPGS
jgi:hypothetical protein